MTRKEFEEYKENGDLEGLCEALSEDDGIHSYDSLKEYAVKLLEKDDVGFAIWILEEIYESLYGAEFFAWDMTAGKCDSIKPLSDFDDAERYLEEKGFEEEK